MIATRLDCTFGSIQFAFVWLLKWQMDENKTKRWQWQIKLNPSSCDFVNNFWERTQKRASSICLFVFSGKWFSFFSRLSWSFRLCIALVCSARHTFISARDICFFSGIPVANARVFFSKYHMWHCTWYLVRILFLFHFRIRIDFIVLIVITESICDFNRWNSGRNADDQYFLSNESNAMSERERKKCVVPM